MGQELRQVGRKLRAVRKAKGMSQDSLAKKARVAREHLLRLEAGRHDPGVGTLSRLAKALGVPVTDLLG